LLDDFEELDRRRQLGERGESPLTWGDKYSWAAATGRVVTPWEWRVIGRIDDAYFFAKHTKRESED
jgi:hypothetical protein